MENYCIYLRKSRADHEAELRGEGETLARHEKTLLELARRKNLKITAVYKEIVSGETISSRPKMQKLLAEVERGFWNGVLVMEIERLARGDTKDQGTVAEAFKYGGVKIITPVKTYDPNNEFDEEYFEFGLFMSRREYKTINRRIQRGRVASVQEGKYIAGTPPYGYKTAKIKNDKGYTLEIHPDKGQIVKLIYKLYTEGENAGSNTINPLGMTAIAKYLDILGVKPEKSEKWSCSTIKDILTNPVYTGKIRWQWRREMKYSENGIIIKKRLKNKSCIITNGLHPPIIDDITFQKAQDILKNRCVYPIVSGKELKNPFTGLIYCGKCGKPLTRVKSGKKDDYYRLKCPNPYCHNISSPLNLIEASIIEFLKKWTKNYEIEWQSENTEENKKDLYPMKKIIKYIENDIKTLKKQLSSTYDFFEQGIYTKEKFSERNKYLSEKISEKELRLINMKKQYSEMSEYKNTQKFFIPRAKSIADVYCSLENAAEKNKLLKYIISKIIYIKDEKAKKNQKQNACFNLDIFPKIQKKYSKRT